MKVLQQKREAGGNDDGEEAKGLFLVAAGGEWGHVLRLRARESKRESALACVRARAREVYEDKALDGGRWVWQDTGPPSRARERPRRRRLRHEDTCTCARARKEVGEHWGRGGKREGFAGGTTRRQDSSSEPHAQTASFASLSGRQKHDVTKAAGCRAAVALVSAASLARY